MGALRWILLLAGLVFLAALAAWEQRRPRQGRPDGSARPEPRSEPELGTMNPAAPALAAAPATGAPFAARARAVPPPRIDLPPLEEPPEPPAPAPQLIDEPIEVRGPPPQAGFGAADPLTGVFAGTRSGVRASGEAAEVSAGTLATPVEPPRPAVVDWPPEAERHIISLRIAALSHERLSGRVVRQALGACGFEHGRFGIFHQPGADGRALLSAANLSKPGIFDLTNMDFQRFSGLSLFAVLPGPLPPAAALDHLLDTAQDLAERLRARLQDEQGLALGAEQLETLRRTVQDLTARAEPTA